MDNFVVSARKYRPATFISVIGQGHITATLKNAVSRGQLAHAYLFCGPRGVGKTTCARIFAKAINCLSPVDSEACGECESCKSFNEGRSFNIHELDAASNNSVDDIRSLTEQVRIPPQIGRYSVYIIDEVHMLSASAFNAFLKTLEEPPAHAVFILATTEKHKIIPTILSRCQIYDFNRIRVEDGVGYLKYIADKENVGYDDESLHLIAQKADGGMRDALSMFDKAVSFCGDTLRFKEVARTLNILDYDTYFNITSLVLAGDYPSVLSAFDEVLRSGFAPQTFVGGLNAHFRDLLMSKSPQTAGLLEATGALLERYKKQGADCDVGFLFEAIGVLTSVDGTLRNATSQRLNVELGLMKLCGLGQKKNKHTLNGESGEDSQSPASALASCTANAAQVPLPELKRAQVAPAQVEVSAPAAVPIKETPSPAPAAPINSEPAVRKLNGGRTISGASISELMNAPKNIQQTGAADEETAQYSVNIDPESEAKIGAAREKFLEKLDRTWPRIAVALGSMTVAGNKLTAAVPTRTLYEELMRNRSELLYMLAEMAGIEGIIELEVEIRESEGPRKPIKAEDKAKFLLEQNPLLEMLKKNLDLDIE